MPKNTKIMSLSVDPGVEEMLEEVARRRGIKGGRSGLFRFILDKFPLDRDDVQIVVLKIPKNTLSNETSFTNWFESAFSVLRKKMFS